MQCISPRNYDKSGNYITTRPPCGKCLPCLSTRRFTWASRIMLESTAHSVIQFVTLTFNEESLPSSVLDLKPILQKWFKRLRKADGCQPRYFACMEFGSRYGRPHYHIILFGRPTTLENRRTEDGKSYQCDPVIQDTWGLGHTYSKDCPIGSAQANVAIYVANYILKDSWKFYDGAPPQEWALQSRSPYIGQNGVKWLIDVMNTAKGQKRISHLGTIPNKVKISGKFWKIPLRMRQEVGDFFDYPVLPVPYGDNTVVDFGTHQVIIGKPQCPKTKGEAEALAKRLSTKIRTLKRSNKHPAHG